MIYYWKPAFQCIEGEINSDRMGLFGFIIAVPDRSQKGG